MGTKTDKKMQPEIGQFIMVDFKYIIIEIFDVWVRMQKYSSYMKCSDEDTITVHKKSLYVSKKPCTWEYDEELDEPAF